VERSAFVGGLARTWHYGDFHFDVGPHRFHTDNPRVEAFVRDVLAADVLEIPRSSGARMFGGYHEWPLRPSVLLAMPPSVMARGAHDLLFRERLEGESFEADIINKYGRTLHDIFFRPYTEKFLFHGPDALHRDWGRAGVNRAVIDKRAAADSLWSLLRTTLMPKPVETTFLYAPEGVGQFSENLAHRIEAAGGSVLLEHPVTAIEVGPDRVTSVVAGRERIACSGVVWTGPITHFGPMVGLPAPDLHFLSTIFYNFQVRGPLRVPYQWTYFGGDEVFSRVTAPTAFARTMAPPGQAGLTVELTCREGDGRWTDPDAWVEPIVKDLVRTGMVPDRDQILDVRGERVPNTYPIYTLNYMDELTRHLRALSRFSNLLLAGRCGRFWYNNMDHSIGQGLTMADRILRGDALGQIEEGHRAFWEEAPVEVPA
jgi:protoporphyrinogen oxidase